LQLHAQHRFPSANIPYNRFGKASARCQSLLYESKKAICQNRLFQALDEYPAGQGRQANHWASQVSLVFVQPAVYTLAQAVELAMLYV
jgi:hypothetical protein